MTEQEFVMAYAARSGVTVEYLEAVGQVARPCRCEYEYCHGWQMVDRAYWDHVGAALEGDKRHA